MIIGSHGVTHAFLHRLKEEDVLHELNDSKKVLEDITGKEIKSFSVPRGVYNKTVLRIALEVGYERVFTSDIGLNKGLPFLMKRIALNRNTSLQQFQEICRHKGIRTMAFMQCLRDGAKRIAGIDLYNKIRNTLIPLTGDQ